MDDTAIEWTEPSTKWTTYGQLYPQRHDCVVLRAKSLGSTRKCRSKIGSDLKFLDSSSLDLQWHLPLVQNLFVSHTDKHKAHLL